MRSPARTLAEITTQLAEMRARANASEDTLLRTAPGVSAWCAAQHLDHLAKVSSSIFRRLLDRDAAPLARPIHIIGRIILTLGWIPRGRGKAPERLHGTYVSAAELTASFDEMETLLRTIDPATLANRPVVPHPKFGGLTPAEALRFVAIHNTHHLRILDDIVRA